MQKNFGKNLSNVESDPITGNYHIVIPEWIINEFEWYDGTEVNIEIDGQSIFISET